MKHGELQKQGMFVGAGGVLLPRLGPPTGGAAGGSRAMERKVKRGSGRGDARGSGRAGRAAPAARAQERRRKQAFGPSGPRAPSPVPAMLETPNVEERPGSCERGRGGKGGGREGEGIKRRSGVHARRRRSVTPAVRTLRERTGS